MIEIEVYKRRGLFSGLTTKGHASGGLGEKGNNPLCSGVSTLVQTLFLFLQKQKLVNQAVKEDGLMGFHLVEIRNPKMTVLVDHSFQMILTGLETLQKQYPEEIRMETIDHSIEETRKVS